MLSVPWVDPSRTLLLVSPRAHGSNCRQMRQEVGAEGLKVGNRSMESLLADFLHSQCLGDTLTHCREGVQEEIS